LVVNATSLKVSRSLPFVGLGVATVLFILVTTQLLAGYGSASISHLFTYWFYDGVGEAAAAACLLRGLRHSEDRLAWILIGVGVAVWTAGDAYYTFALQDLPSAKVPYPSLADVGYLGFYPPTFVGIALLVRSRIVRFDGSVWLDSLIASLTACSLTTGIVLGVVWQSSTGSFSAIATNIAYPAGDALLLSLVVGALALSGWRLDRAWLLVGGGLVLFSVGDSTYLFEVAKGTYRYGTWLDVSWLAAFVVIAGAACAPSARRRAMRLEGWGLVAAPVALGSICISLVLWDHFHRVNVVAVVTASLALVAVLGRLSITFGEYLRLLDRTRDESLTDALTGLRNRRALILALDDLCAGAAPPPHLLLLFDLDGFKAYNDSFGHNAGDAVLRRLGQRLRAAVGERGHAYRLGGDEFCILVEGSSVDLEWVQAAASASLRESGEGFAITCSGGHVLIPLEADTPSIALEAADRRMYAEKGTGPTHRDSRKVLLQALVERDTLLGHHTSTVADLASALAAEAGLVGAAAKLVRAVAELHDVGKLALPETLLQKPEPLDDVEWRLVRQHTIIGERIVSRAEGFEEVASTIRSTHERWDGSGYPDRLEGEEIPRAARVVAVCDAYDAMTSDRPYRDAMTPAAAADELRRTAGSQFDPELVEIFLERVLGGGRDGRQPLVAVSS
jgi:diguanylate cyclase (GGDEF)-like protein/putative nucleotidyltransferase with HDIG domain